MTKYFIDPKGNKCAEFYKVGSSVKKKGVTCCRIGSVSGYFWV